VAGAVALGLLALRPSDNLGLAVVILIPVALALYGTALAGWWKSRKRGRKE
jgi:hypothetical protein